MVSVQIKDAIVCTCDRLHLPRFSGGISLNSSIVILIVPFPLDIEMKEAEFRRVVVEEDVGYCSDSVAMVAFALVLALASTIEADESSSFWLCK